jgi:hypothetical protein|uniref:hypothetical protein n=1 Tax=Prosthecobacter sp. TaxID=1965333 RepID=UPI00378306DD
MPFDPTKPANNSPNSSAEMRAQLTGLKELIDAVPAGPPGENGTSVTGAVIDGTNTLNPGEPAQASVNWDGANVRFTFGIPRGQDGVSSPPITSFIVDGVSTLNPGEPATVQTSFNGASVGFLFGIPRGNDGTNGSNGNDGGPGAQGPPFANAVVDSVTTLNPGDNATVQTIFDGSNVRFQFGIPRGNDGSGSEGPPGEVTNAQLSSAIAGTSNFSNAVALLGMAVSDPPTQSEVQQIVNKLDELINALRR